MYQTDANQKEIIRELKRLGFSVEDFASKGRSFPDLLVAARNITIAVEIKTEAGKFRLGQLEWMARWKGFCGYATTLNEILAMFERPNVYCLMPGDKERLLGFVARRRLDGKCNQVAVAQIRQFLEK